MPDQIHCSKGRKTKCSTRGATEKRFSTNQVYHLGFTEGKAGDKFLGYVPRGFCLSGEKQNQKTQKKAKTRQGDIGEKNNRGQG